MKQGFKNFDWFDFSKRLKHSLVKILGLRLSRNKRGVALPVILAFLITTIIISLSIYFKSSKRKEIEPELLTKLKIDYYLESGIAMAFNHLKGSSPDASSNTIVGMNIPRKEVLPEVFFSLVTTQEGQNSFNIRAQVEGLAGQKQLSGRASIQFVPMAESASGSDSAPKMVPRWGFEYIP